MANITASIVKELRERTGLGMMDCKKALAEADGDMEKAIEDLRKALKAPSDATAAELRNLMNKRLKDDSEFAQQHNIKLFNEALKSMGGR